MNRTTSLLIVGAGPYGLAAAAEAQARGVDFLIVGKPMDLWRNHMPEGMVLRSDFSWHFDPLGEHTYEEFLRVNAVRPKQPSLISRDEFLAYADWFIEEKQIRVIESLVTRIARRETVAKRSEFVVQLDSGDEITATNVLVAVGYRYFVNRPDEVSEKIPAAYRSHTFDWSDFSALKNKRVLLVGGRQSAYETAALLAELGGSTKAYLTHRKEVPRFTHSNWDFVDGQVRATIEVEDWYRSKSSQEKADIFAKFYGEGRLKLEPWLGDRLQMQSADGAGAATAESSARVVSLAKTTIDSTTVDEGGALLVVLRKQTSDGSGLGGERGGAGDGNRLVNGDAGVEKIKIVVDHVMFATGYKPDASKIDILDGESIASKLRLENGFPVLDSHLQSNIPGLFFSGIIASQDFGLIFGFVKGAPAAAKLLFKDER